ncbi:hypothetical protein [Sporichthya sp.]|uniref:hypothetical protein n=1 Tax=Sporichthya sp. TaxID=65475 RepID=UPI001827E7BD|nr:hypothetical protein [Sporichthya sp.]MBA3742021.1 hypothetical protein [Sporichthya sp.]
MSTAGHVCNHRGLGTARHIGVRTLGLLAVVAAVAGLVVHLFGPALQHGAHDTVSVSVHVADAAVVDHGDGVAIGAAASSQDDRACGTAVRPSGASVAPVVTAPAAAWDPPAAAPLTCPRWSSVNQDRSTERLRSPGLLRR